jgi:hypothetical protein
MTKLNDTQLILLTSAAQRDDGALLPAPDTITVPVERLHKAIGMLITKGLAAEMPVANATLALRSEGDNHIGAAITDTGRTAIGVENPSGSDEHVPPAVAIKPERETKAGNVLAMLQREQGATLAELVESTGWLPHTTRAALTGLRKKGHAIDKSKRGEETCYNIVVAG